MKGCSNKSCCGGPVCGLLFAAEVCRYISGIVAACDGHGASAEETEAKTYLKRLVTFLSKVIGSACCTHNANKFLALASPYKNKASLAQRSNNPASDIIFAKAPPSYCFETSRPQWTSPRLRAWRCRQLTSSSVPA